MDTGPIFISMAIWLGGVLLSLWLAKELAHYEVERRCEEAVVPEPVKIDRWGGSREDL